MWNYSSSINMFNIQSIFTIFIFMTGIIRINAQSLPSPFGGAQGNPGTRFCIRPKGLNTLRDAFGKIVDVQIPKVTIENADIPISLIQKGLFSAQSAKITKYSPAKSHSLTTLAPDLLIWQSNGFSFTSIGTFTTSLFQLNTGTFTASATNANVQLNMRMDQRKANGKKPYLYVVNCTNSVSSSALDIQFDGFLGAVLALYKDSIVKQNGQLVKLLICEIATSYVENIVNDVLSQNTYTSNVVDKDTVYPKIPADLIYNYNIMKQAVVPDSKCFQVDTFGEVSWQNVGGTGFNPANLDTTITSDNMMDVYVSDYSFNSMLYHGYAHNIFDTILNNKDAQIRQYLEIKCGPKEQCIGSAIPELQTKYIQQVVQVQMSLKQAPYVLFSGKGRNAFIADSVLTFTAKGKANKQETFLTSDCHIDSDLLLDFNKKTNQMYGNITVKKVDLKVTQTSLANATLTQQQLSALNDIVKVVVEKMANQKLSKGFVFTDNKFGQLVEPSVKYAERTMIISTGFTVDQTYLLKATEAARKNSV